MIAGAQWQPKAAGWTDFSKNDMRHSNLFVDCPICFLGLEIKFRVKMNESEPPPGWVWEDEWTIDANRAVDEQGKSRSDVVSISMIYFFIQVLNIVLIKHLGGWCPD